MTAALALAAGVVSPVVASGPADAATTYCYGFEVTVLGTAGSERIDASDGVGADRDVIHGLGGDDVVFGHGGDDVLRDIVGGIDELPRWSGFAGNLGPSSVQRAMEQISRGPRIRLVTSPERWDGADRPFLQVPVTGTSPVRQRQAASIS